MTFATIAQGIESLFTQTRVDFQIKEHTLYIPLLGKRFTTSEEVTDLEASIRDFTSDTNPKQSCVLYGDGGSGKSFFLQQFTLKLLEEYIPGKPIPLFIALPLLTDPINHAIDEHLEKHGFNEEQITKLKKEHSFIFIFDGYDEIHQLENLYVTNRLHAWNAKTIISCRTQYFYNKSHSNLYFMPLQDEREQPHLLQTLYVASFNQDQIENYLSAMRERGVIIPSYAEITKIPGLRDIITTPFLLQLTVEALPEILARYSASSSSSSSSSVSISSEERQRLTQTDLYKSFLHRWFLRQENKLKMSGHITPTMPDQKPIFWRYCQALALKMHELNITWLNTEDQSFAVFFENDIATEILRSACPVKIANGKMGFWHQSLGTHFVGQTIYHEAMEKSVSTEVSIPTVNINSSSATPNVVTQARPKGTIHLRLITDDPAALRALADDIETDSGFKERMFDVIECSKNNKYYAVGAANAISALNTARVSFSGMNFQAIQIPYANLSEAILDHTNLSYTDLTGVSLRAAWLHRALLSHCQMKDVIFGEKPLFQHPAMVTSVAFSSDGQWMASADVQGNIKIWNSTSGQCVKVLISGHIANVNSIDFSPDSAQIISGGADKILRIWNLQNDKAESQILCAKHDKPISSVNFSYDGKWVVSGGYDETIQISSVNDNINKVFRGHEGHISSARFSTNGYWIVSGGGDKTIRIWDVISGQCIKILAGHTEEITSVDFSSDNQWIVSGSFDRSVRIWSVESGDCVQVIQGHTGEVSSVRFSPNNELIVSCGGHYDLTVRVWDIVSSKCLKIFDGHTNKVTGACFSPDGQWIISGSYDETAQMWSINPDSTLVSKNNVEEIISVHFSSDNKLIVSESLPNSIQVWDALLGDCLKTLKNQNDFIISPNVSPRISPNNQLVAFAGSSYDMIKQTVQLWDLKSNKCKELGWHAQQVTSVSFSPDNQWVISGSSLDNSMRMWGTISGASLTMPTEQTSRGFRHICFAPNGLMMVSGSIDNTVRVWVPPGQCLHILRGHNDSVESVAFSPDGRNIISGSGDKTVRLWEAESGKCTKVLTGHTGKINNVHFSFNGLWIISTSANVPGGYQNADNTVRIFNAQSGRCLKILEGREWGHTHFSSDGQLVVSGGKDKAIKVWLIKQNEDNLYFQLIWISYQITLFSKEADLSNVTGLSTENYFLFKQRGALGLNSSEEQTLAKIVVEKRPNQACKNPMIPLAEIPRDFSHSQNSILASQATSFPIQQPKVANNFNLFHKRKSASVNEPLVKRDEKSSSCCICC